MGKFKFRERDRVRVSGKGRTRSWDKERKGTVEKVLRGSVFVVWDGLAVGDEMEPGELVSLGEAVATVEPHVGEMAGTAAALENITRAAAGEKETRCAGDDDRDEGRPEAKTPPRER